MLHPLSANPKSVMTTISLFDDLISKLNNLVGLDSDSKTLLSNTTTIEYWFKNNEFDASEPRNIGYDYLSPNKRYKGSNYIREITSTAYMSRLEKELRSFFKKEISQNSLKLLDNSQYDGGSAYLSPRYCYLNTQAVQIGSPRYWKKDSLLASRILNYNLNKKLDIPKGGTEYDKYKSSITSIYADLGLTIERTYGGDVDESPYSNGDPLSGVAASKLHRSLMVGFMKAGVNNDKNNENLFTEIPSAILPPTNPKEAGIEVWKWKYDGEPWSVYNTPKGSMRQTLMACRNSQAVERGVITAKEVRDSLPNQLKSLYTNYSKDVIWNLHDEDEDPTRSSKAPVFQFRYNKVNAVEYLVGYEDATGDSRIKNPIWELLTGPILQSMPGDSMVICRMREFECQTIGVEHPKGLKLPVYDNYFILKGNAARQTGQAMVGLK